MRATSEELLELVNRSPAAVAIHDKQAWLELFSRAAVVQDPVGTAPHRRTGGGDGATSGDDPLDRRPGVDRGQRLAEELLEQPARVRRAAHDPAGGSSPAARLTIRREARRRQRGRPWRR